MLIVFRKFSAYEWGSFSVNRNVYDEYCIVTVSHDIIDIKKCCKSVSRTVAISWCLASGTWRKKNFKYIFEYSPHKFMKHFVHRAKEWETGLAPNCLFNTLVVIQLIKTLMKINWVPFVELESRLPPALLAGRELVINKLIITHLPEVEAFSSLFQRKYIAE